MQRRLFVGSCKKNICHRTQQHSEWNCVGANKPQQMHMYSRSACDRTPNTHKKNRTGFCQIICARRKSNSNLLINSKNEIVRIGFRRHGNEIDRENYLRIYLLVHVSWTYFTVSVGVFFQVPAKLRNKSIGMSFRTLISELSYRVETTVVSARKHKIKAKPRTL